MRKIVAVAIMIIMLIPALFILPVNDATAGNVKADVGSGEFVPVTLYFHREEAESELDTKFPTNNTTATEDFGDGEAITFATDYLLADLNVNGGEISIEFWVDIYFLLGRLYPTPESGSADVNLTFSIYDRNEKKGSTSWNKKWESVSGGCSYNTSEDAPEGIERVYINMSTWDEKQFEDTVKLTITPTIETENEHEEQRKADFYYDSEDYPSNLQMSCAPVEIELSAYDKDNDEANEFMPNLAADDCIIKFKGSVEDAFGYEDITYVSIEITGPSVHTSSENITGNVKNETESLYEWDYSDFSTSFVADTPYTATITVETVQLHTFTQTTNFNFSAYGLEAKIDNKPSASETITAGNQTDYTINIRNTGASEATVNVTLNIFVSPSGQHRWNISLNGKSKEVNTTGNLLYPDFKLTGGYTKSLTLTTNSLNVTGEVGDDWECIINIKVKFVGTEETGLLLATTVLAPPHKIDINWSKTPDDPYYVLVDVSSSLSIDVTNMGSLPDTVDLTLNYTNYGVWDITFKNGWKNTTTEKLNPYRYTLGGYEEEVELIIIASSEGENEATTSVNITACSQGNKSVRDYLTLNLSRAFGISPLSITPKGPESVDVENSSGQVTYDVLIETSDNTTHTVDLIAEPGNENIEPSFDDDSVEVSKDSSKTVTLTVTCPKGMLAGSYTITVTASIIKNDAPVSEYDRTVNVTVTVNEYHALSVVWVDSNENEITVAAKPGEYIHKTLKVKNEGNSKISVDLTPKATSSTYGLSITFSPYSQFDLSPKEEKNITLILGVPEDAMDGETLVGEIEATSPGLNKVATIIIEVKQNTWDKLINTLYSMIYFIILLIAVIVVFISVWVKKKKMR